MSKYKEAFKYYDKVIEKAEEKTGESTAYASKKGRLMRYYTASRLPVQDHDSFESDSLLDVGCGPGHFANWLAKNGNDKEFKVPKSYYGIEPHPKMFSLVEKMKFDERLPVRFDNYDVFDLHEKFDWIIANGVFVSLFCKDEAENFEIFTDTVRKMWDMTEKGLCFDVTRGDEIGIIKNVEPGYDELKFSPFWVEKMITLMGCERYIIDCSTSTRYLSVYMYKRPQVFERIDAEDIE